MILCPFGSPCLFWGRRPFPKLFLKGGVLLLFVGRWWRLLARGVGGVSCWGLVSLPGRGEEVGPLFLMGFPPFSGYHGAPSLPGGKKKKRGFLVLCQVVKGSAPLPSIKCEMGSPHALLWRVIKGPARRVSARGWGPISPAPAEGWGAGFAHSSLVGQRKRWL